MLSDLTFLYAIKNCMKTMHPRSIFAFSLLSTLAFRVELTIAFLADLVKVQIELLYVLLVDLLPMRHYSFLCLLRLVPRWTLMRILCFSYEISY